MKLNWKVFIFFAMVICFTVSIFYKRYIISKQYNVNKYVDYYSPNSKKVFLSFGGPTENYHNAVKRIANEAKDLEIFDTIIPYTEKELLTFGIKMDNS